MIGRDRGDRICDCFGLLLVIGQEKHVAGAERLGDLDRCESEIHAAISVAVSAAHPAKCVSFPSSRSVRADPKIARRFRNTDLTRLLHPLKVSRDERLQLARIT
jgi:hypothetical protein